MQRNSKDGAAFGRAARAADYAAALTLHEDEINKVDAWAKAVAKAAGVSVTLGQPLV